MTTPCVQVQLRDREVVWTIPHLMAVLHPNEDKPSVYRNLASSQQFTVKTSHDKIIKVKFAPPDERQPEQREPEYQEPAKASDPDDDEDLPMKLHVYNGIAFMPIYFRFGVYAQTMREADEYVREAVSAREFDPRGYQVFSDMVDYSLNHLTEGPVPDIEWSSVEDADAENRPEIILNPDDEPKDQEASSSEPPW